MKPRLLTAALFAAAVAATGCGRETTAPGDAGFLQASVTGSVHAQYSGSGSFGLHPAPIRFSLFSQGRGASQSQSFHFVGRDVPGVGAYPLQDLPPDLARRSLPDVLEEDAYLGAYTHREGRVVRTFRAISGAVQVSESRTDTAPRRIAGTFTMVGVLSSVCEVSPGFPGEMWACEYVDVDERVEVAGSFAAGPLGGDAPGLAPYWR